MSSRFIAHIRFLCIFSSMLVFMQIGFAQHVDAYLPQTIIFKVKEKYRNQCSENKINNIRFNQLFNDIEGDKLRKIFPHKSKEKFIQPSEFVDLSLIYQLHYNVAFSEEEVIRRLSKLKIFEYVERYIIPHLTYTPNDISISNQYYLGLINAFNAWNITKGDTNIVIGITDTGWEPTHSDLIGNVKINYADPINGTDDDGDGYVDNYMGWDLGMNDNDALYESTAHGVYVTGLAAAVTDNINGVAGVGFDTKFLPIKISNSAGVLTHAYQGIVYAADHGCFVINCSWGSFTPGQFQKDIIDYAIINKGSVVVAAVGNNNSDTAFYPAAYEGVLSVAATEQSDLKKNNSNYGYYIDVSAPGEAMYTTAPSGTYATNGGTSMAAPVVAGGAALLKAQFPSYTNQQIIALLKATADDLNPLNPAYTDKLGKGRLNLVNALTAVNPQFLDLTSTSLTDYNNNLFEEGDTVQIVGLYSNYLATVNGATVTLTTTSPYINIIDGTTSLPTLNTLDTVSNYSDPFFIEILNGSGVNEAVVIKATISAGGFTNNEYISFVLNQDYIDLAENKVSTSITSKGKIGYNDVNNSVGLGFSYQGEELLYEAGLMIGDNSTRVSDIVRGIAAQKQDFLSAINVQENYTSISELDLMGAFSDVSSVNPLSIYVRHYAYAFKNPPDDKYVIVVYDIENVG